jgi:hypothetical protein
MTSPTIQPGTRCGCGEPKCGACPHNHDCDRDAVRMVPVLLGTSLDGTPMLGKLALCAACAEYAESRVAK